MSTKSAGLAQKMGFRNLHVMLTGAPGWKKAGYLLVASDRFVTSGNRVLVDLRPPEQVQQGHIAGAVNIPFAELTDAEDDFPSRLSAPIVLYGDGDDAGKAAKMIQQWGYRQVALVAGGLPGFVSRRNRLTRGPAAEEILWQRKLGKGEVSVTEFQKALHQQDGQLILDVRTNDEVAHGRFPGSRHIPLDALEARLSELPRDREILIHCATGDRAEMAWQTCTKAGLTARFLVATVECEDGTCTISE